MVPRWKRDIKVQVLKERKTQNRPNGAGAQARFCGFSAQALGPKLDIIYNFVTYIYL